MNKEAITRHPISEAARKRWSPRAFKDQPVEKEKLIGLLEAARWAASGGNAQPWRFIIGINHDETWETIFHALDPGNQEWNKHVPVLMVAIGAKISPFDGNISPVFQYDAGQAVATLTLEAVHQGLHVHQMGGFSVEMVKEKFEIPDAFLAITVIAVGYIGDPETLSEKLKQRELQVRSRKNLEDIVFSGKFGNTSQLVAE
jgi:nitroreductase